MNSIHRSDFGKICRICLKIKTNMSVLYNTELINKIDESLNIKILVDNDLPNSICKKCTRDIDTAFQLKQLFINSQKILEDIIRNEEFDDKQAINHIQIKEENTFGNDVNLDAIIKDIVKEEIPILTEPKEEIEDGVSDVDNIEIDDSRLSDDKIDDTSTIERDEFNNFKCSDCGKCFRFLSKYKYHITKHIPRKPQACQSCGKIFYRKVNLLKHQPVCDGINPQASKRGLCNQCGKTARNLELHIRIKHGDYKPYVCPTCTRAFKYFQSLTNHILHVHEGKKYEKPHLCNECGQTFRRSTYLREHMLRHLGQKPFKCKLCNAEFSSREGYRTHMAKHTNTRVRRYACTVCEKKFYTARMLRNHMRVHTGERPYSCKICQKTFTQTGPLSIHMKSHKIFGEQLT